MKRIFKFILKSFLFLYAVLVTVALIAVINIDFDELALTDKERFERAYNNRPTPDVINGYALSMSVIGSQVSSDIPKPDRVAQALKIVKKDGRYFWASQGNRELTKTVGELESKSKRGKRKVTIFTSVNLDGFIIIRHDQAIFHNPHLLNMPFICAIDRRDATYSEFRFFKGQEPKLYRGRFDDPRSKSFHVINPSFYPPMPGIGCTNLMLNDIDLLEKYLNLSPNSLPRPPVYIATLRSEGRKLPPSKEASQNP